MRIPLGEVVCGIDFSPASIAALEQATALAREHGARVHAVHAYPVPMPPVESGMVMIDEPRLVAAIEHDLRELVARHAAPGVPVECHASSGWAAGVILHEARVAGADLIALGTRGLSGLPRFLLGSVAERVARTAQIPVLVVPEALAAHPPRPVHRLLCGVDFSEPSDAALRASLALAALHRASLHVVHVWKPPSFVAQHPIIAEDHERDLRCELDGELLRAGTPDFVGRRVVRGEPSRALAGEAEEIGADLVVVGSTGRSGAAYFLLGSVAERLLRVSPAPVLVVRGPSRHVLET